MADIVMPLRYIISASARWASVRIVCFRVILLANLVPSSYGHLLPALSIETSPLSSLSSIEAQQSQALLTFFKLSVEMRTSGFKAAARRTLMDVSVRLRFSLVCLFKTVTFLLPLPEAASSAPSRLEAPPITTTFLGHQSSAGGSEASATYCLRLDGPFIPAPPNLRGKRSVPGCHSAARRRSPGQEACPPGGERHAVSVTYSPSSCPPSRLTGKKRVTVTVSPGTRQRSMRLNRSF